MSYYALIASVSAQARLREGEAMKERATKRVGRGKLQWVSGLSFIHARCKMLMGVLSCDAFMGNRETDTEDSTEAVTSAMGRGCTPLFLIMSFTCSLCRLSLGFLCSRGTTDSTPVAD